MTRLYLVRHGETEWNKNGKVQGRTDTELSPEGVMQAELLARRLAGEDINVIYSSSLRRALKTAEIIAEYKQCEIIKSDKYHEICFGPWEGMTINEIKEKYSEHYRAYREDPVNFKLPGAETLIDLTERTYGAVMDIVSRHTGSNILLVSHGTAIKAVIIRILGLDIIDFKRFMIDNASVSILEFPEDDTEKPVLICLNDTSHLEEENM
ncbi:MAG TPA: histidine phosphatase family protein [Bacillota bacterium]|nr:histidine phosphatase family protein [Bacillota bacterium]HRU41900.1 histidine phosphatase family protein [Candidatus Diapherotrites archaeon]HQE65981.1 histidine phosphatase family protein [Bacillota bacterium]HQI15881.1 histidine phosphatase family protein [Bacillota bacterium]HQJ36218.1 histidine phosphatase family protein [Bacillota bacterium]